MNKNTYGSLAYWQEEEQKAEMAFHLISDAVRRRCAEQLPYLEKRLSEAEKFEDYSAAIDLCDNDLVLICKAVLEARAQHEMCMSNRKKAYADEVGEEKEGEDGSESV